MLKNRTKRKDFWSRVPELPYPEGIKDKRFLIADLESTNSGLQNKTKKLNTFWYCLTIIKAKLLQKIILVRFSYALKSIFLSIKPKSTENFIFSCRELNFLSNKKQIRTGGGP